MVSVGYMDPGNWATDIAAGSKYGYALLSAIVLSSICAMVSHGRGTQERPSRSRQHDMRSFHNAVPPPGPPFPSSRDFA